MCLVREVEEKLDGGQTDSLTDQRFLVLLPWLFVCFLPSKEEVTLLALAWCAIVYCMRLSDAAIGLISLLEECFCRDLQL